MIRLMLSDAQRVQIAPELSGKAGDRGCRGRDNRLFIEAVLWIARTGSPWRDRIATRYEKTDACFAELLNIVAAFLASR